MRILILTQWFEPEPTAKGLSFATALRDRGHNVEVLTGFPNYPGGSVYPGYRVQPYQKETLDGIQVHRVPLFPSHDTSGIHRAANYATFAASTATIGRIVTQRPDVVYVYNLVTLAPAAIAQGAPFLLDIQDLWPDTVANSGMLASPAAVRGIGHWCDAVYRRAAHITVLSPGMREELVRRGVPGDRATVVYNWCDERNMRPSPYDAALARSHGLEGKFVVLFAGTMGITQRLDSVLDAAALLAAELPDVRFAFIGGGVQRDALIRDAKARGLSTVVFLPRVPASEMPAVLGLADAQLVHLEDTPLFRFTIPSKTQASLASGTPVIMGVRGDAADMVARAKAGVTVTPQDARSIADGVATLYRATPEQRRRMGENGAQFYSEQLSMAKGVARFEQLFEAVRQ